MKEDKFLYNGLTGIVVFVFGIIYSILSYFLPRAVIGNSMAPIYFPAGLGFLLIIMGILLYIKSEKSKIKESLLLIFNKSEKDREVGKMVFYTCAAAILYAVIFEKVGFVVATFLFMISILSITNKKKHIVNTIVASVFSFTIYALFNYALGIPLPGLPFL